MINCKDNGKSTQVLKASSEVTEEFNFSELTKLSEFQNRQFYFRN